MAKPKESEKLQRSVNLAIQETAENSKQVELSFSSEEPYRRLFGIEILDHSEGCVDLSRLNDIGVVLFNHDRDKVIGKVINARVEEGRGKATIEFDDDDFSANIKKKVDSGTLKAVSVGYLVKEWEEVKKGKTSADGRFKGECVVAKKWLPYEISIVSVPADSTVGVGRTMEEKEAQEQAQDARANLLGLYEKQLAINFKLYGGK
nr:MAG TPA: major capsid protein [Caudoviricetes sp.]